MSESLQAFSQMLPQFALEQALYQRAAGDDTSSQPVDAQSANMSQDNATQQPTAQQQFAQQSASQPASQSAINQPTAQPRVAMKNAFSQVPMPDPSSMTIPTERTYGGNPASVDSSAPGNTGSNGKPLPFYERNDFYNNLLNFGAATLAASGETDANGVPLSGLAAIGKGVLGAVQANRAERELQSNIAANNATNAYRSADALHMGYDNFMNAQRANLFGAVADGMMQDNAGSQDATQQSNPLDSSSAMPQGGITANGTNANMVSHSPLLTALGQEESGNDYGKVNQFNYLGKYQLGQAAMQHAGMYQPAANESVVRNGNTWGGQITVPGFQPMSAQQFLSNPAAQEAAMTQHLHTIGSDLQNNGADQYIGKTVNGMQITPASLIAGAHVAGVGGMMNFLQGNNSFQDGNGVNIPQYVGNVMSHINNPQLTGANTPAAAAQQAARTGAYGSIVGSMFPNNPQQQLAALSRKSMGLSMLGIQNPALDAQIKGLSDLIYQPQVAAASAQATLPAETAKMQFGYDNAPLTTRDTVTYTNPATGERALVRNPYRYQRIVDQVPHEFLHTEQLNPDYTVASKDEDLGATQNAPGFNDQAREVGRLSSEAVANAGNVAEASQTTQSAAREIRDLVLQPGFAAAGPGSSTWAGLVQRVGALANMTGMNLSQSDLKNVSDARTLAQLTQQIATHTLGETAHVRTGNEFKTILSGNVNPDDPVATTLYNVSAINGSALDDMAFSKYLANAQQSALDSGKTFNVNTARNAYLDAVKPRTLMWADMLKNGGEQGQAFMQRIIGTPGQQTATQRRNYAELQTGMRFLQQNNVMPNMN